MIIFDKIQELRENNVQREIQICQYKYFKELAGLKYRAEEERRQNLISQASQMQAAFSFITAAFFAALTICVSNKGKLPLSLFLITSCIICALLLASLILASLAQWRFKTKTLPDISTIAKTIFEDPQFLEYKNEAYRTEQYVQLLSETRGSNGKAKRKACEFNMCFDGLLLYCNCSYCCKCYYFFSQNFLRRVNSCQIIQIKQHLIKRR